MPKPPKNIELTIEQKHLLMGVLLTDGSLEVAKTERSNSRIQFTQSEQNRAIMDEFVSKMSPFISQEPQRSLKSIPLKTRTNNDKDEVNKIDRTEKFVTYQVWTLRRPALTKFSKNFVDANFKKTVPSLQFLIEYLSWETFAWMIMCDGSAHDPGRSQAMKLHMQNFSFDELTRVCLALYHKLGIQCWPAFHKRTFLGKLQYHIKVSGRSLPVIHQKALPLLLEVSKSRVPPLLPNRSRAKPHPNWVNWYQIAKKSVSF